MGAPATQTAAALTTRLSSFLPRWQGAITGELPLRPELRPLAGAAIFVDISGFSELTRRYQDKGEAGVEELSGIIGSYLGQLIDRVYASNGDVEGLYGDAVLAFWPAGPGQIGAATAAAIGCAENILTRYDRQAVADGIELRIRAAVVAGNLSALQVGGPPGEWHFLLGGRCLLDIGAQLKRAGPGEIVTSAVVRRVAAHGPGSVAPSIDYRDDPALALAFLPPWLRRRAPRHLRWLAEFRALAVLCIGIEGLPPRGEALLQKTQEIVEAIHEAVCGSEGSVIRVSMSDKGVMVLAAFGLPEQAHDDDAVRAVWIAWRLPVELQRRGLVARGTATFGTTYCGIVGNDQRRVYTAMGDPVNRAAKLLESTEAGCVCCDAGITQRASSRVEFESAGQGLFRPMGYLPSAPIPVRPVLGREAELERLERYVAGLDPNHTQPVLSLEGEPGIGKSTIIAALSGIVAGRFGIHHGAADAMAGRTSPLGAWSSVLESVFEGESRVTLGSALAREGMDERYLPLAAPALRVLDHGELPLLQPADAARITRDVIASLLRDRFRNRLCLVVLDDVHWMDSASWELAAHVARTVPGVKLILSGRPVANTAWSGLRDLEHRVHVEAMRLGPLDAVAIASVVAGTFGTMKVPNLTVQKIQERSSGNPLFAIQLALSLADPVGGAEAQGSAPARLPETIQRTIVARVDRLPDDLQVTLKAASVIGTEFSSRALEVILQPTGDHHGQGQCLAKLTRMGVIRVLRSGPDLAYKFDHALVQEAVYALLPFEQRSRLHRHVATFYCEAPERRPGPAIIGLHWSRANCPDQALPYWEAAGTGSLAAGAYREAAAALQEAVAAAEASQAGVDRSRKGRLNRLLGEVLLHCGQVELSQRHFVRALDQLQFTSFGTRLGAPALLARWLVRHLVQRSLPRPPHSMGQGETERLREAALAFEGLGQVFGHITKITGMLATTVAALTLSQRIADTAVSSRSAGLLAVALQMANVPRLGRHYLARSQKGAETIELAHDRLLSMEYGALFLIGGGLLHDAATALRAMLRLAEHANNRRRQFDATSLLILTTMAQGEFEACLGMLDWFRVSAEHDGDQQVRCWMYLEHASFALANGRPEKAREHLDAAGTLMSEAAQTERVWASGLLAACLLRQDSQAEALEQARWTLAALAGWRSLAFYAQDGVFGAAEVFLHALEQSGGAPSQLARETRLMMRRVARFGLRLPLSRARTLVLLGRYAALRGRRGKAERLTKRALDEATQANRPTEQAFAREQLRLLTR